MCSRSEMIIVLLSRTTVLSLCLEIRWYNTVGTKNSSTSFNEANEGLKHLGARSGYVPSGGDENDTQHWTVSNVSSEAQLRSVVEENSFSKVVGSQKSHIVKVSCQGRCQDQSSNQCCHSLRYVKVKVTWVPPTSPNVRNSVLFSTQMVAGGRIPEHSL